MTTRSTICGGEIINILKMGDFFAPSEVAHRIHIIGCGAIGSTVAENLVRCGLTKITLYDHDKVAPHNIANQMFCDGDIGKPKVEALASHLRAINPDIGDALQIVPKEYTDQRLAGYVTLCVDNIELRKKIAEFHANNPCIVAMFDWRIALVDGQHYAADWSDRVAREGFISTMQFSQEEALAETPVSACNIILSVAPTVRLIAALGVANMLNFMKDKKTYRRLILADAFNPNVFTPV